MSQSFEDNDKLFFILLPSELFQTSTFYTSTAVQNSWHLKQHSVREDYVFLR